MAIDVAFLTERLIVARTQLTAVDIAITKVIAGGTSYSLDSGQTRQMVTRSSLKDLTALQEKLVSDVQKLVEQLNGGGSRCVIARPGF